MYAVELIPIAPDDWHDILSNLLRIPTLLYTDVYVNYDWVSDTDDAVNSPVFPLSPIGIIHPWKLTLKKKCKNSPQKVVHELVLKIYLDIQNSRIFVLKIVWNFTDMGICPKFAENVAMNCRSCGLSFIIYVAFDFCIGILFTIGNYYRKISKRFWLVS